MNQDPESESTPNNASPETSDTNPFSTPEPTTPPDSTPPSNPFSTPESAPEPSSSPQPPVLAPTPRKSKKLVVILAIVLVLLIAGGVFAYLFLVKPNQATTSNEPQVTENQTQQTDPAKEVIARVKSELDTLKADHPTIVLTDQTASPSYKATDKDYYTSGEFGYQVSVTQSDKPSLDDALMTAAEAAATKALTSDTKFVKGEDNEMSTHFDSDTVTCEISKNTAPVFVNCANIDDYAALYEQVDPFAEAYFKAKPENKVDGIFIGAPTITEKGQYANAYVQIGNVKGVGGAAQLFYKEDGNWVYWRGTQSIIACDEYNSVILQHSYEGDKCYDNASKAESTVKVTL